jgi:hypothetical protein
MSKAQHRGRSLVRALYNQGVRPTWNALAKPLRAPLLPAASFAAGGRLPAASTGERGLITPLRTDQDPSQGVGESKSPA